MARRTKTAQEAVRKKVEAAQVTVIENDNRQTPHAVNTKKKRPKYSQLAVNVSDIEAVQEIGIRAIRRGIFRYENTSEGLNDFKDRSLEYLAYVHDVNVVGSGKTLVPDIESWAAYCGISRVAIHKYEHGRGAEWVEFIQYMRNIIASFKKQLLFNGQIPQVIGIFDMTNNHGYINSSEFKFENKSVTSEVRSAESIFEELGIDAEEKINQGEF